MDNPFKHVAVLGLGLIASSICLALRRVDKNVRITGYDINADHRSKAADIGLCDQVFETSGEAVKDADLVILAVPVGAMGELAKDVQSYLSPNAILTDVGSVKGEIINAVSPYVPDTVSFIPGHPLAGTEYSGPEAGFSSLFDNRWCLLTPLEGLDEEPLELLTKFWQSLGANVDVMDPEHHDLVLATTSHAPHLIAYTMVGVADDLQRVTESEVINYSAAGFRDFTRIAASDPTMWRDVFLNNKKATLEILGRFTEELFALQRAIRVGDGDHLFDYFNRTRAIRRGIIEAGQDTDAPNFGRTQSEGEPQ